MFRIQGEVTEVVVDKTVRGAFGMEPALQVKVRREPGRDFTDSVFVPDTAANRAALRPGFAFDAPCILEAVHIKGGNPFVVVRSAFQAKA